MEVSPDRAPAWIGEGGLLAYPTETLWGLGADSRSERAVAGLRAFKKRDDAAPISILVPDLEALEPFGFELGPAARRLAEAFWPGPLTLVMACDDTFAPGVAREDGAVGVRCSPHAPARDLAVRCARAGVGPVTATSCNRSGDPAARTRDEARSVCEGEGRVGVLTPAADAGGETASTVIDVTGVRPQVLRWGGLPEATLQPVLQEYSA